MYESAKTLWSLGIQEQISFSEVLKVIGQEPLFGDRRGKTRWVVFMKHQNESRGGEAHDSCNM